MSDERPISEPGKYFDEKILPKCREGNLSDDVIALMRSRFLDDVAEIVESGRIGGGPLARGYWARFHQVKVGDPFPLTDDEVGDCPGMVVGSQGIALCVLDAGHEPPHIASDGETVVEVWVHEVEIQG